ncbi:hypothetical protein Dimus_018140, partial [Dionaea muscipula]
MASSPTFEELDQQVDELLAHPFISKAVQEEEFEDRNQEGQRDVEEVLQMGEEEEDEEQERGDVDITPHGRCFSVAVQTDDRRCRKIDRLMEEKFAPEQEIKELKFECDSTIEISSQVKADVEMVMEENQSLEKENEELKTSLEGEKNKVQTLEEKVKELQAALKKEKVENEKKENELVASYKKHQELLRKNMDLYTSLYARKEENEKLHMALAQ